MCGMRVFSILISFLLQRLGFVKNYDIYLSVEVLLINLLITDNFIIIITLMNTYKAICEYITKILDRDVNNKQSK